MKNVNLEELLESDDLLFGDDDFDELNNFDIEDNLDALADDNSITNKQSNNNETQDTTEDSTDMTDVDVNKQSSDEQDDINNQNNDEEIQKNEIIAEKESIIYNLQQEKQSLENKLITNEQTLQTLTEENLFLKTQNDELQEQIPNKLQKFLFPLIIIILLISGAGYIYTTMNQDNVDALYSNISTQSMRESVTLSYFDLVENSHMTYEEAFALINSYPKMDSCSDDSELCSLYNEKLLAYNEFITILTNDPTNMKNIIKNYKLNLLDINKKITDNITENNNVTIEDNKLILS